MLKNTNIINNRTKKYGSFARNMDAIEWLKDNAIKTDNIIPPGIKSSVEFIHNMLALKCARSCLSTPNTTGYKDSLIDFCNYYHLAQTAGLMEYISINQSDFKPFMEFKSREELYREGLLHEYAKERLYRAIGAMSADDIKL